MKYPQSVEMPRQVQDWLESELEARGIDAAVYTRHILNLLQQDFLDYSLAGVWSHISNTKEVWSDQEIGNTNWNRWCQQDALKRLAVIECLMSASSQKCDAESLVDELCAKLAIFQSTSTDEVSTYSLPAEFKPFSNFQAFSPAFGSTVGDQLSSPYASPSWTRGILRASLDKNFPYQLDDNSSIVTDCFSYPYYGHQFMEDRMNDQRTRERLYERTATGDVDHATSILENNLVNCDGKTWNPFPIPFDAPSFLPDQSFFSNKPKLFSPALFPIRNIEENEPPSVHWSIGGALSKDAAITVSESHDVETGSSKIEEIEIKPTVPKEDLLISSRTHFRPIKASEVGSMPVKYADGTTFPISPDIEPLKFQRSESGTLFLETSKYMEYKVVVRDESDEKEFIPKFRVEHHNEKFSQTEDSCTMTDFFWEPLRHCSSVSSLYSDSDTTYSSNDDFCIGCDDAFCPAELEVAQIVAGKLNVRYKKNVVPSPPPEPEYPEAAQMNLSCEGLAELLDSDTGDEDMDEVDETAEKSAAAYWPADKVWNPENQVDTCDYCEPPSGNDDQPANPLIKGIWGCRVCKDCKEKIAATLALETAEILKQKMTCPLAEVFIESKSAVTNTACSPFDFETISNCPEDGLANHNVNWDDDADLITTSKDAWKDKEVEAFPDWGPIVNKDMSVFLEVERVAALKSLSAWSPVNQTGVEYLLRKNSENNLRNLWSPAPYEGTETNIEDPVWMSIGGLPTEPSVVKPITHSLMRDELIQDGDQLLTHLRYLHLQQQDSSDPSDVLEEDSFPTEPPSPQWGKGRIVNMWAYWNIKTLGNYLTDERQSEAVQKERKRRHSSSHRPCESYLEGECRRRRYRFIHGEVGHASPLYAPYIPQRAFTM